MRTRRHAPWKHTQSHSRPTPSHSAQRLDFLNAGPGKQKHATLAAYSVRARGPTSSWWAPSQFWVSLAIDARRRTATSNGGMRSRRPRRVEFAVAPSSGAFHPVRSGRRRCRRNCPPLDASHPHTSALYRDDQRTARTSKPPGQHRSEERAHLLGAPNWKRQETAQEHRTFRILQGPPVRVRIVRYGCNGGCFLVQGVRGRSM